MTKIFPRMSRVEGYVFVSPARQSAAGTDYALRVADEKREVEITEKERKVEETDSEIIGRG